MNGAHTEKCVLKLRMSQLSVVIILANMLLMKEENRSVD